MSPHRPHFLRRKSLGLTRLGARAYCKVRVHESGRHAGCDTLVTRKGRDFQKALLPVYDPHELVCLLDVQGTA